jgi:uncharacterized protein (DUF924 family)
MTNNAEAILEFWFGHDGSASVIAARQSRLWWKKQEETDALIKQRFEPLLQSVLEGEHDDWALTPLGRLALIIVLDQFPRNIYRDTPKAFAFDQLARSYCLEGLKSHDDAQLAPIHRVFFYLPLEHAEDRALQARSVALFRELVADVEEHEKQVFSGFADFAVRHQQVIDLFGRFPHRNAILSRPSTAEELEFLTQPGSSF